MKRDNEGRDIWEGNEQTKTEMGCDLGALLSPDCISSVDSSTASLYDLLYIQAIIQGFLFVQAWDKGGGGGSSRRK